MVHAAVAEVIEIIRPAIQADGGDINLIDVDEGTGIVQVELHRRLRVLPRLHRDHEGRHRADHEGPRAGRHRGRAAGRGSTSGTAVSL